jgi:membrane protein DedA with SNARE-associated domain
MDKAAIVQQALEQAAPLIAFIQANREWAVPIVFLLAFGESLAFLSLFLPFWAMLVGIGTLVTASGLDFWSIWLAASLGAALGDWVSYWIGAHFQYRVTGWWPLSRYPGLLPKGEAFFRRWGWLAVFGGRFSGPLRATVPLAAGITHMPILQFQLANFISAFVWAATLMLPGAYLSRFMPQ